MKLIRACLAVATATALAVSLSSPAFARGGGGGGGENTSDGFAVEVHVTFSGDAAPDGGGGYTVSVPATCWWTRMSNVRPDAPDTDAAAMLQWRTEYLAGLTGSSTNMGWYYSIPSEDWFEARVAEEAAGTDLNFYTPQCQGGWEQMVELGYTDTYTNGMIGTIPVIIDAWAVNVAPPAPVVDPEDLAIEARDLMVIDEPTVDRNPKMVEGPANATFVNVPTWFWVTNPEMVGGTSGTRTIRAQVDGSNVWAEVTATTGGLSIASPAGSRFCDPVRALRQWSSGADDAEGCTVEFSRASIGHPNGYPVTAATEWTATWEGQNADGAAVGGDLDPLARSTTVNVPVAEVQTLVQRVG